MLIFSGKQVAGNLVTLCLQMERQNKEFLVQNTVVSIPIARKTENFKLETKASA